MILAHFVGDRINLMRRTLGGDQKIYSFDATPENDNQTTLVNSFLLKLFNNLCIVFKMN